MQNRITPDMARQELQRREAARAELMKRGQLNNQQQQPNQEQDQPLGAYYLGGLLKSAQGMAGLMPNPFELPKHLQEKVPIPRVTDIDIKKLMGLKEHAWNTPEGASEIAGEFTLPLPPIIRGAKPAWKAAEKGIEYLQPGKVAEKFRTTLGQGTTKENIEELGKRVQFAKGSAKSEALIPKNELYSEIGESNVLQPIDDLKDLLSTSRVGHVEKGALESKYFSEPNVTDFYSKKGKLFNLHKQYEKNSILSNSDPLESALKKEIRELTKRKKAKTITDLGEKRLEQYEINLSNIEHDKTRFFEKIPDKLKELEYKWRGKYKEGVGKYEESGSTKANDVIRKLAKGKSAEVTSEQIGNVFTHETQEVKKILDELGPSAGRNILYNALQHVKPKDAEGLANSILELKRTKGYDRFVTKDIEQWANKMLVQVKNANRIKKTMLSGGGALAGQLALGPYGAAAGALLPFAKDITVGIAKHLGKKK